MSTSLEENQEEILESPVKVIDLTPHLTKLIIGTSATVHAALMSYATMGHLNDYMPVSGDDSFDYSRFLLRVIGGIMIGVSFESVYQYVSKPSTTKAITVLTGFMLAGRFFYAYGDGLAVQGIGKTLYEGTNNALANNYLDDEFSEADLISRYPEIHPFILEHQASKHFELANSYGAERDEDPEFAAKLALHFDGWDVHWKPNQTVILNPEKRWDHENLTVKFGSNWNWEVTTNKGSLYFIGPSSGGVEITKWFSETFSDYPDYIELLESTSEMNGRPLSEEVTDDLGKFPPFNSRYKDELSKLSAFAPYEWNHIVRRRAFDQLEEDRKDWERVTENELEPFMDEALERYAEIEKQIELIKP